MVEGNCKLKLRVGFIEENGGGLGVRLLIGIHQMIFYRARAAWWNTIAPRLHQFEHL